MPPGYHIRTMAREEIAIALDWAAAEGWNPGLHDAACFHAADPQGFLVGELDGKPVASISVVKYGADFAFLGFYIVRPQLRGQGLGWRLWQAGMERLAGRNVGLDGVLDQQENYRQSGFALAYRNIRHQGTGGGGARADARIVPLSSLPFDAVQAYDAPFFAGDRSAFLRCWIAQPGATALGFVEHGVLEGYGVLRPCRDGFKIGPLFADEPEIAESLLSALKAAAGDGATLSLDTPEVNRHALELAARHGMSPVFECARMYTGPAPQLPLQRLYGVTSFELG